MRIAVIIPTLNEEPALRQNLREACSLADEVIVSDGGSTDGSRAVAVAAGARVVTGAQGRGPQLNLGAQAATAEVLLFLHADTRLPRNAVHLLRQAVESGAEGGAFLLRFDNELQRFRLAAWLINWRTRLFGVPLGDQAQFVTKEGFLSLGGFRDWPILEDLDFARRLKKRGRMTLLAVPVVTSARRYLQGGLLKTAARNWLIWFFFLIGVSPHRLVRLYRPGR